MNNDSFSKRVLDYNQYLSTIKIDLPRDYKLINPFNRTNKGKVNEIVSVFYNKYYNDNKSRRLIIGSSPARRGTAVTGIPFEDIGRLKEIIGVSIDDFNINKSSANFLYDVIDKYGGSEKFYSKFYMNFVFPLGIIKINSNGKEVNCNYYEDKKIQNLLFNYILESLKKQIALGIDTSIVYCIGSGDNYKFLLDLNSRYHLFDEIIPLEHPRFIMQYNSKNKDYYIKKYLDAFNK